ncbi:pilus assembly protein PilY [Corallococcus sp. M34]|uniref:pilus assembly protein n=1 Tax=Citreicoccus inhibens TaxID=2849499 RepID=UPI001C22D723|nr:PilC/PilY family type IV pilus protein [Citreicoccus inhibens]MBU8894410.1 pilus assembly protein PilY [Citreicoccus inhibens]
MKVLLSALSALAVILLASPAHALDPAACTLQSTSRLDGLLNPARGSDERFFTAPSGPPNILIILDTSGSMAQWPIAWKNDDTYTYNKSSTGTDPGCRQENINALNYDPSVTYPRMWTSLNTKTSNWFEPSTFYRFDGTGSAGQVSFGMNNNPMRFDQPPTGTTINTNITTACNDVTGNSASALSACRACLQTRGYFQYRTDRRLATGNFLNFYSPRGHSAVNVISQVINDSPNARFGIMTFSAGSGATGTVQWAGWDVVRFAPFGPSCTDSTSLVARTTYRGNLLTKMNAGLRFNTNTPLTQVLWGASYYMRSSGTDPFPGWFGSYPSDSGFNDSNPAGQSSICFTCGFNSIILLTDGEPNEPGDDSAQPPAAIRNLDVPCVNCSAAAQGANSGGSASHIHRIAKWMATHDMRPELPGSQPVATYTVGFALTNTQALNLLRTTAQAGTGKFYAATNSSQLKTALQSIVDDVQSRNISFASAAISSFQTGNSTLSALMPRLAPGQSNAAWKGDLWRFNQFNEFVQDVDKNGDGDKADIFVVDQDQDVVVEDNNGAFVKDGTSTPARQYWEARRGLLAHPTDWRKIYTVTDSNHDGRITSDDSVIEFSKANAATLQDYLGVLGTGVCPKLLTLSPLDIDDGSLLGSLKISLTDAATAVGLTAPPVMNQAWLDSLCVRTLIEYVRGKDLADEDEDGNRTEPRISVLGDIFHSSPVVVDPPVDKFICDMGLHNQCARTLYSQQLGVVATPLVNETITRCGNTLMVDAYDAYLSRNRLRDKLVLVGANDGMLHAFRDSTASETCVGGLPMVSYAPSNGDEVWAFIPPDLLSRLHELASGHNYYVDGDIMVRDIWADGSGGTPSDSKKQSNEFHTLAILSEGRGGVHYLALELTADASNQFQAPKLRWMYPQPDSAEAALFGKTLFALSPKPPPVGPLLVQGTSSDPTRYGSPAQERWMVALSGGWSPSQEKGRGVYMVDAWEPQVNGRDDNLWWKFEFNPTASGQQKSPSRALTDGVVAPVALVDFGANGRVEADGFFDTAVFGDMRGQLWVARMSTVGTVDSSTKLIGNWSAARAFQQDRDASSGAGSTSIRNVSPFFYVPSIGIQADEGVMRALVGTGDRYSLLDANAGGCRFDNPQACAKYQCTQVETDYAINRKGLNVLHSRHLWQSGELNTVDLSTNTSSQPDCGNPGDTVVTASFTKEQVLGCPGGPAGGYVNLRPKSAACGRTPEGYFRCEVTSTSDTMYSDLDLTIPGAALTGLGKNRFYGVRVYGGPNQTFDEGLGTYSPGGPLTASVFDDRRLTDRNSSKPTEGDLVDVTNTTCGTSGACTGAMATRSGAGWFVEYTDGLAHKTAGGASTVASCTLWNSLFPSNDTAVCSSSAAKSRFFQADFITGAPNCAASFKQAGGYTRYQERTVLAPPPEPATAVMVSPGGKVKYSTVLQEPGKKQATTVDVSQSSDVLQNIYELPLTRDQHECRHVDPSRCAAAP